jgi:prepilin-type N-terminal cleavage/methylation domain-containing protein
VRTGCGAWPQRRLGASPRGAALATSRGGFTLLELLFAVGILATLSAVAVPELLTAVDRYQALGAARHVAATLQKARMLAVSRGANVGLRFVWDGDRFRFTMHIDGNRDGLSTRDIADGADPPLGGADGLEQFGGARFGLVPGLLLPDGTAPRDDDPIRLGSGSVVSFTPNGTASAGSLYVRGPGGHQYVVRIYGDTGKTQVLRYARNERRWVTL